jgi:dsDNA-binding SOS-regulon protein
MSAIQIARSKARFTDPVAADRFEQMLQRADALVTEAAKLRREAWSSYRAAIRESEVGQYA